MTNEPEGDRLDDRDLATVLAALRSWQARSAKDADLLEIATDG